MIDRLQHEKETGQIKKNKKNKKQGSSEIGHSQGTREGKRVKEQGGRGQSNIVTH